MRYEIRSSEAVKRLGSEFDLADEIAVMRWTVQDLINMFELQQGAPRMMMGSMLRDAIDMLSRVVERAAKLPQSSTDVPVTRVVGMLKSIEEVVCSQLPDGSTRQQLILSLKEMLEGISIREEPSALVLRTCEMMDMSVPRIEE